VKWDIELRLDLLHETLNQLLFPSHRSITVGHDEIKALEQCVEWLEEYIAQPHPQLGKDGEICPFARPALHQDQITFLTYPQITHPRGSELRRILEREGIGRLRHLEWKNTDTDLTTVLVLFPGLNIAHADVIQAAYLQSQDKLNGRGIMLGAFFPGSVQPGHYNAEFHAYQAPFPIYVLRPMGVHDILFISSGQGFREYRRRYAVRFEAGTIAASTGLPQLYHRAAERFSQV
jgi:heptaprenyl diphosphate synthase